MSEKIYLAEYGRRNLSYVITGTTVKLKISYELVIY